ncbi:acyltransferase [Neolewinella lacunae]|uniref:Acyltransferase n=1 Tax=Neolewinella lacunae TaxID=1517758 RepID=A0A923PM61_9BACT|nr:acyltransferase [Neolewinella lacunae]MBC6996585.1 acyltransferase [Neolewinella lacunae]MDN3634851.1 acyltransferase [Neolewinella lacunae]
MPHLPKIAGFDGVRALAVFFVLVGHSGLPQACLTGAALNFYLLTASHDVGVRVFFVLSGYLIGHILLREKAATGTVAFGRFLMRRVLRLVPAYLLYLLVLLVLVSTGVFEVPALAFLAAFLYLYNYLPYAFGSGYTNHLWSLALEEQFYLLYPLAVRAYTPARLARCLLLFTVIGLVLANALYWLPLPAIAFTHDGEAYNLAGFALHDLFDLRHFLLPAGLYCLVGCYGALHFERWKQGWVAHPAWPLWGLAVYLLPALLPLNYGLGPLLQACGVLLWLLGIHARQGAILVRLLAWGPLPFLGRISYGTYLWHGIFITTGTGTVHYWWQGPPWGFLFTYLAAVGSFYAVERPFLRLKDRYRPD